MNSYILGLNERNSKYIFKLNQKKQHIFAKNKFRTKEFLRTRGFLVSSTYGYITNRLQLKNFNFNNFNNGFVIKPNKGAGGEGILIIKRKIKENIFELNDDTIISKNDIIWHCEKILDGLFNKYNIGDNILIEEKLTNYNFFDNNIFIKGLIDIRIIVVNLIPIMAMMRIPHKKDTANINQGAIAVGIDIVNGKYLNHYPKNNIDENLLKYIKKIQVPYWDKLLLYASEIQHKINIGYLSVDFAISENSKIYVLEVNSRSGLKIQLANNIGLKNRLEKVIDIITNIPQRGIEISKQLFGGDIQYIYKKNKT